MNQTTHPPRILVVDDERAARLSLGEILQLDGCQVQAAASGEEALKLMQGAEFEVMVLDIKMPGLGGMQLLAEARRLAPQMVIIMLTAYGTLETALKAIDLQVFAYLLKPVAPDDILATVRRGLARRRELYHKDKLIDEIEQNVRALRSARTATREVGIAPHPRVLSGGGLVLDFDRREATVGGKNLHLTPTEIRLLGALMMRPDHVLAVRQLVQVTHGYEADESEAREIIRPVLSRLRGKLARYPHCARCLVSVRGQGYMFTERG